jgi:hypothetical protein
VRAFGIGFAVVPASRVPDATIPPCLFARVCPRSQGA